MKARKSIRVGMVGAVVSLAVGAITPGALANHDRATTTTLSASPSTITVGASVGLSGSVTWLNPGGNNVGTEEGTVTVSVGDSSCTPASLVVVGSHTFTAGETTGAYTITGGHTPAAAGTYGYVATFAETTHGNPPATKYRASSSTCHQVTVDPAVVLGRGAPAWANDYLRGLHGGPPNLTDCQEHQGTNKNKSNWHGQLISKIAQKYEGQSFVDAAAAAPVFTDVNTLCGGGSI